MRPKTAYDGAIPSANSVMAENLLRLSAITGDLKFKEYAYRIFDAFEHEAERNPTAYTYMLNAALYANQDIIKVVFTANTRSDINDMISEFLSSDQRILNDKSFKDTVLGITETIMIFKDMANDSENALHRYFQNYRMVDEKPTAYVCKGNTCYPPVNNMDDLKKFLHPLQTND